MHGRKEERETKPSTGYKERLFSAHLDFPPSPTFLSSHASSSNLLYLLSLTPSPYLAHAMKLASAILLLPFMGMALALPVATIDTQIEARACNPEGPCYSDPSHVARAYSLANGGYSDVNNVDPQARHISEKERLELEKASKHHSEKLSKKERERLALEAANKHHYGTVSHKKDKKLSKKEKERLELEAANKHHHGTVSHKKDKKLTKKEKERLELEAANKHHYGTVSHETDD